MQERRGDEGVTFMTYDQLLELLARRVVPDEDAAYKSFVTFSQIRFDCDDTEGISFRQEFVNKLSDKSSKELTEEGIEPLTLWNR